MLSAAGVSAEPATKSLPKTSPIRKIGVVAPLTGTTSAFGETVRGSVQLASAKFDPDNKVAFIFEDDQLQAKNTVSAVHKLIEQDKVDGLLIFGSATSLAVNSLAEAAKVPMIALSILEKVVEGKKFVMKHWVPARAENDLVVGEVKRNYYKRLAIVTTQNDAMLNLRALFLEAAPAQIVADEQFPREIADFRATCAKIRAANPDAVYLLLWAPQPGVFARQLREIGYSGSIFGAHNLEDPNEIKVAGGALQDAWFVTAKDTAAVEYFADYEKRFSSTPTAGGVNAYDVAKMFIEGAGESDLNAYFHNLKGFKGGFGTYGATSANDFEIAPMLKKVSAERVVPVESAHDLRQ